MFSIIFGFFLLLLSSFYLPCTPANLPGNPLLQDITTYFLQTILQTFQLFPTILHNAHYTVNIVELLLHFVYTLRIWINTSLVTQQARTCEFYRKEITNLVLHM